MQPPPRKVKETQQVKVVFAEQVGRLHTKQQQEVELLEDIRSFSKQRAAIEKEYSQALQRLAVQFQKRDWQRGKADALSSGSVFGVWRLVVDSTAQNAVSRLAAADAYRTLSGHASRTLRNAKELRVKRGLEQLQRVQGELVEALRELQKVKKSYYQLSHIASVAREKAADAQTRAKKSEHGIFHFRTGLQKMSVKLSSRLRECDERLTEVRNEYLMTLAAINAHHHHYYITELHDIMECMDGDLYVQLRGHLTVLCGTEMDVCLSTHRDLNRIWDSVAKVTRERNVQQFLQESPCFTKTSGFSFQLAPHDMVCILQSVGADGESCLEKEARKWSSKVAKDYKIITHGERALHTLNQRLKLLSGETGAGVERKLVEVEESVRKAKVSKVKAESRLALLSEAGVGVEPWLGSAMTEAEEELERARRLSEQRLSVGDFSDLDDEFDLTDFEDYDENRDIFMDPTSGAGVCVYPLPCRVLFSYQASQSDELSIMEGEELQVIEDGDVEDWLKARNLSGQVGYVPERYLQFQSSPVDHAMSGPGSQLDSSFSSTSSAGTTRGRQLSSHPGGLARALYSYQGQSADELSFPEGALIRLRRCGNRDVDDGFWEEPAHPSPPSLLSPHPHPNL
ncbi:F-BAR and double SH3 domains protein 1-like [Aplochiton taeniatus]